jgi:integrase
MSVHFDRARSQWSVHWREGARQRTRRFATEEAALDFDAGRELDSDAARVVVVGARERARQAAEDEAAVTRGASHGVYRYETKAGLRWRLLYRRSDGSLTSRRGFASRRAALDARRGMVESVRRGEILAARETFADFYAAFLETKRPYITHGTWVDYEIHGRKRLLPLLGVLKLSDIDEDRVRAWMARMAEAVAAGDVTAKTVNNARMCLSMACAEAVRRRQMPRNPCQYVRRLPVEREELEYLRMHEIARYLDACAEPYRPLAEFLIGTGVRISEALGLRWSDLDLDAGVVRIARQRSRANDGTVPTKGRRFRSVQVGPQLATRMRALRDERAGEDGGWVFLCPPALRGQYSKRTEPVPPSRKTAWDWHVATLQDAGLRYMPLHALRHTAATAWLGTGHPLIFVQRQLGHRSITTTEEHYGHLEASFVRNAAAETEAAIARAGRRS